MEILTADTCFAWWLLLCLILFLGMQVRKSYEARRKRRKERGQQRSWKLKSMQAEAADEPVVRGKGRHGKDSGANREELDRERFMQVCPLMQLSTRLPLLYEVLEWSLIFRRCIPDERLM